MRMQKAPQGKPHKPVEELAKHKDTIAQLAQSRDARRLMELLQQGGSVQEAAKAAAGGNPEQLVRMMDQLMRTKEGAQLVDQIRRQAKKSGLE